MNITVLPFVSEFKLDFSSWTLGILVLVDESKGIGTALLHLSYDPESGFSFDCCFVSGIIAHLESK